MAYEVIVIPMPDSSAKIEDEINNATSDGSTLISIAADKGNLIIVTQPK